MITYGSIEQATKDWLATTSVAALVTRAPGALSIYLSMPPAAPVPAVLISLIGGGPLGGADLPQTRYRVQFDCIGTTRDQASMLARTVIGELEWLGRGGPGAIAAGVYLGSATVLAQIWAPDPDSDRPRYIVDTAITTVT